MILYILYPAHMAGTSQRGGPHSVWVPPPCEVPGIYAGYRIYPFPGHEHKLFSLSRVLVAHRFYWLKASLKDPLLKVSLFKKKKK